MEHESRPTPRKFRIGVLVIGVLGIAEMVWQHSMLRPGNGVWWTWLVLVGVECIGLGLAMGWAITLPKGQRMTSRQRWISFVILVVCLETRSYAEDSLGTDVSRPFLGLILVCFAFGFFLFAPLGARRRESASIG